MAVTYMDRETFLAHLRRSELLTPEQLAEVMPALPDTHRGRLVARVLVQQGLLTRFQAEMLLAGRTNGFQLGQYRILAPLGRGGMGRVFQALHRTMNRMVALKLIAPQFVNNDVGRRLFEREVRAAARLAHPNIVTAYDANQIGDRLYLIMEYVDGPNLEELVRERGPLDVGLACEFIRQAALGLQYAFEMGMVHRDIKPANLLVQRAAGRAAQHSCVVKILDFGLAQFHDSEARDAVVEDGLLHAKDAVLGTPDFISPEQARNGPVDIRSDLYSLGGTLYYLLTGQVPFPGGTNLEKLVRHGTAEPQPAEELRPSIPQGVRAVLRRLLAKDPAARFQTPAELAEALVPFARNGPPVWPDIWPGHVPAELPQLPSSGPVSDASRTAIIANFVPEPLWAMNTVSGSASATPFSVTGLSAVLRRGLDWQAQKPWRPWVLGAATFLTGVLGWAAWHVVR